jgi:retinol-binding protein 3
MKPPALKRLKFASLILAAACLAAPVMAQAPMQRNQADIVIAAPARDQVIDQLVKTLNDNYVFPEQAKRMEKALRGKQAAGEYKDITSATQLADVLTADIRAINKDQHLLVSFSERAIPEGQGGGHSPEERAAELADLRAMNFGIERVERLPFNIGYLDFRVFARPQISSQSIAAAMTLLSNSDAIIIDLRRNGGGEPDTVTLLASYLLDSPVHLSDIHYRRGNRTDQMWTKAKVDGAKVGGGKAVYILTSEDTFSAAEDFSYAMKHLKRAKIVGEKSAGGAHPGDFERLSAHFLAFVPNGRTVSKLTNSDWEGTGVEPDIAVPATHALAAAQQAILTTMLARETDKARAARMQARIAKLDAEQK